MLEREPAPKLKAAFRQAVGDRRAIIKHRLFWPVVVLVVLLATTPGIYRVGIRGGHLYGSIIDILLYGSPLLLVALGMTLVIATGGIDLSVGAVIAIAGAVACTMIADGTSFVVSVLTALVIAIVLGLWNGTLVALLGIQPIVATLILMVAGRGIAQLITSGQTVTIHSPAYKFISGFWLGLPFSIMIAAVVIAAAAVVTRGTALGLLIESVGGNAEASRLVGIRSRQLKIMAYAACGLCAGIAGLMISSNISAADSNAAGLYIELDAILAVVIGGTSLLGGRFSLTGTVIGALIIQTLTTTIYTFGVPPQTTLVVKALVVIVVCLLQAPRWREARP
jgi:galactofuranose transport system permease protein